jgi:hypothetical protein
LPLGVMTSVARCWLYSRTCLFSFKSHDSSVGIALGYGLDYRGSRVRFPAGAGNFSLHHRVQNVSGGQSASYPMGTRGLFPWGYTGRPPSSAEVKNAWSYTSIPQYVFMAWCLVKHRDNFTFTFFMFFFSYRMYCRTYIHYMEKRCVSCTQCMRI